MLWAQLTAALFMTAPKKLCPLADGSLAEAARGGGGGEEPIASAGGPIPADTRAPCGGQTPTEVSK